MGWVDRFPTAVVRGARESNFDLGFAEAAGRTAAGCRKWRHCDPPSTPAADYLSRISQRHFCPRNFNHQGVPCGKPTNSTPAPTTLVFEMSNTCESEEPIDALLSMTGLVYVGPSLEPFGATMKRVFRCESNPRTFFVAVSEGQGRGGTRGDWQLIPAVQALHLEPWRVGRCSKPSDFMLRES